VPQHSIALTYALCCAFIVPQGTHKDLVAGMKGMAGLMRVVGTLYSCSWELWE